MGEVKKTVENQKEVAKVAEGALSDLPKVEGDLKTFANAIQNRIIKESICSALEASIKAISSKNPLSKTTLVDQELESLTIEATIAKEAVLSGNKMLTLDIKASDEFLGTSTGFNIPESINIKELIALSNAIMEVVSKLKSTTGYLEELQDVCINLPADVIITLTDLNRVQSMFSLVDDEKQTTPKFKELANSFETIGLEAFFEEVQNTLNAQNLNNHTKIQEDLGALASKPKNTLAKFAQGLNSGMEKIKDQDNNRIKERKKL